MRALLLVVFYVAVIQAAVYKTSVWKASSRLRKNKATGSTPFYTEINYINITVGNPAWISTHVPLDITSGDLIINPDSEKIVSEHGKSRFDISSSSALLKKTANRFTAYHGSQIRSPTFSVQHDTVSFAGITIQNQTYVKDFHSLNAMGLAWPPMAGFGGPTVLENLVPLLDLPLFSIWLDNDDQRPTQGMVTFGAYDEEHCAAAINWVPLTSKTYWQFSINGVSIGAFSESQRQDVMMDSSTLWIGGPTTYVDKIAAAVGAVEDDRQEYLVNCSTRASLPDLVFKIGGNDYSIPASEYTYEADPDVCELGIYKVNWGGFAPNWILGKMFMRSFCSVFDVGNVQIGLAKAKHSQH